MDFKRLELKHIAECIYETLKDCGFDDPTDSSGYYTIKEFIDKPDRVVDVYKSNFDGIPHYSVYCSYEDEQFIYRYTEDLSVESLLRALQEFYDEIVQGEFIWNSQ